MLDPGAPAADPNATQQMPGGFAPNQTQQLPAGLAPDAVPGFVLPDATQQAISIACAVCQTPNPPGERWCQDCGFMLGSTPGGELPDAATQPRLVAAANGG